MSTQKASSRVSCNHCCELNFDSSNETSGLYFTQSSLILSIGSSQRLPLLFCSLGSPNCSQNILRHHKSASSCVKQPDGLNLLLNSHLVDGLVLNRSLLFLIDSRSDLSHRHFVSTFDPLDFATNSCMFSCSLFLIHQRAHHEFFESFLLHFIDPSTRSSRFQSCPDFCLRSRSCPSISIFVTNFPNSTRHHVLDDFSVFWFITMFWEFGEL